jgi:hypothetical protein
VRLSLLFGLQSSRAGDFAQSGTSDHDLTADIIQTKQCIFRTKSFQQAFIYSKIKQEFTSPRTHLADAKLLVAWLP